MLIASPEEPLADILPSQLETLALNIWQPHHSPNDPWGQIENYLDDSKNYKD
jgi:hypothetical protein